MRTALLTLLTLAITWSCAGLARADASPFPGPPETCTEIKKEQPGTDCEVCPITFGDDDSAQDCADQFADTGFSYVCTSSDYPQVEVWCDGPPRVGCSLSAAGAPSAVAIGLGSLLAALAIGVLARRRR